MGRNPKNAHQGKRRKVSSINPMKKIKSLRVTGFFTAPGASRGGDGSKKGFPTEKRFHAKGG
jgi:hypothetical protein